MAKRGRAQQQRVKSARVVNAEIEQPAVWLSQMKEGVNYGVRDYGKAGRRTTERAIAEFLRVKHFVEVELPETTARYEQELMERSRQLAAEKKSAPATDERSEEERTT